MLAPTPLNGDHHEDRPSIATLFRQVADDVTGLVRTELKLARAEVSSNVSSLVRPAVLVVAAALLGLAALFTLMGAFVGWLTPIVGSAGTAALIVAAAVGLVAFILLRMGLSGFSATHLVPKRAIQSVQADVATMKDQVA